MINHLFRAQDWMTNSQLPHMVFVNGRSHYKSTLGKQHLVMLCYLFGGKRVSNKYMFYCNKDYSSEKYIQIFAIDTPKYYPTNHTLSDRKIFLACPDDIFLSDPSSDAWSIDRSDAKSLGVSGPLYIALTNPNICACLRRVIFKVGVDNWELLYHPTCIYINEKTPNSKYLFRS